MTQRLAGFEKAVGTTRHLRIDVLGETDGLLGRRRGLRRGHADAPEPYRRGRGHGQDGLAQEGPLTNTLA